MVTNVLRFYSDRLWCGLDDYHVRYNAERWNRAGSDAGITEIVDSDGSDESDMGGGNNDFYSTNVIPLNMSFSLRTLSKTTSPCMVSHMVIHFSDLCLCS